MWSPARRYGVLEAAAIGTLCLVTTLAVFLTYSRFPAEKLYHVSKSGPEPAVGRAIVMLNMPIAFIALALLGISYSALRRVMPGNRIIAAAALIAVPLCLITAVPGVVRQSNLDFRVINLVPAIGVLIAAALLLMAIRSVGLSPTQTWGPADTVSAVVGALFVVGGLPWIFAEAGFYIEDIPGLGAIFVSKETEAGTEVIRVHLGDHHGIYGVLFVVAALTLARVVGTLEPHWLDRLLSVYLAFVFSFGVATFLQDFWHEQVIARGWATAEIPSTFTLGVTPMWGMILLGTVTAWLLRFGLPLVHHRAGHGAVFLPS